MSLANRTIDLASKQVLVAADGTAAAPSITNDGDTNTGMFFPAADTIAFSEGGVESMRIDSSGNVGIGTTSPSDILHVSKANGVSIFESTGISSVGIRLRTNSTDRWQIGCPSASADLAIYTGAAATERLRIDSSGRVGIGLTPTSRNNTRLQIVDGIGFPSTEVASSDANTLDDYEEGTWTMGVSFGGASAGVTYSKSTGAYTKIGRKVTVSGDLTLTSKGSSTGGAKITGLPFTITNSDAAFGGIAIGFLSAVSFADFPQGFGDINTTTIPLRETTNAGVNTALTDANFDNASQIIFTFTYFV